MNNWYVWKCYLVRYDMCRYCMRSCFVVTLLATSNDGSSLFESAASSFRGNSEKLSFSSSLSLSLTHDSVSLQEKNSSQQNIYLSIDRECSIELNYLSTKKLKFTEKIFLFLLLSLSFSPENCCSFTRKRKISLGKIEIYEDLQFVNCTFGIDSPPSNVDFALLIIYFDMSADLHTWTFCFSWKCANSWTFPASFTLT